MNRDNLYSEQIILARDVFFNTNVKGPVATADDIANRYGLDPIVLTREITLRSREKPLLWLRTYTREQCKEKCEQNLIWLARDCLGYYWNPLKRVGLTDPPDPVHLEMVELRNRLERFKLGIWSRNTYKTTLLNICGTVQDQIRDLQETQMISAEKWNYARRIFLEVKFHLLFNELLKELYGNFKPNVKDEKWQGILRDLGGIWNKDWLYVNQVERVTKEPSIVTSGVDCEVTGWHPRKQKHDDLVGPKGITTEHQKQKTKDFVDDMIDLASTTGEAEFYGTPWACDDAYYYMKQNWLKIDDGNTGRKMFAFKQMGILDDYGKSIMPSKYSEKDVETLKNSKPLFKYACQYMCNPLAEGNTLISRACVEKCIYFNFPYEKYGDYDVFVTIDPGLSENPEKCFSGIIVGIAVYPFDLYIDYAEKGRWKPDPLLRKVFEIIQMPQYKGHVRKIGIEKVSFQETYEGSLWNRLRAMGLKTMDSETWNTIMVQGLFPLGAKDNRIYRLEIPFTNYQIHIREGLKDLMQQVCNFPHISENNRDLLDALAYMFDVLPPHFKLSKSAIIEGVDVVTEELPLDDFDPATYVDPRTICHGVKGLRETQHRGVEVW